MSKAFNRITEVIIAGREISSLRCDFRIEKNLKPEPNTMELIIYNLNENTRSELQNLSDKKIPIPVSISVGYEINKELDQIWNGDMRSCTSVYEFPDWVTYVSSGDGERATQVANIKQSFGLNTPINTVLKALVKSINDSLGANKLSNQEAEEIIRNAKLKTGGTVLSTGVTLSGNAVRELIMIAKSAGLNVSFQDNKLQIIDERKALNGTAINISSETGLIGIPEVDEKGNVKFQHIIMPGFKCGMLVSLKSKRAEGLFRIESLSYMGSTWTLSDWVISVSAIKYG